MAKSNLVRKQVNKPKKQARKQDDPITLVNDWVNAQGIQEEIDEMTLLDRAVGLIDQRYELLKLKQQIEEELARIDEDLKEQMTEGEVLFGSHGIGYRLSVANQEIYGEDVIQELDDFHLLPLFARVSTSRLKELVREGLLPWDKFQELKARAKVKEIPSLREVILPSAKLF